ncbi:MAG: hypothetical protein MUF29_05330 [Chitinophagaceae bacterium]|jgi:hypothetical protein|nr:hypothetical protein [Chitinophagaceae bacterium]
MRKHLPSDDVSDSIVLHRPLREASSPKKTPLPNKVNRSRGRIRKLVFNTSGTTWQAWEWNTNPLEFE